jgi:hypothetical protein
MIAFFEPVATPSELVMVGHRSARELLELPLGQPVDEVAFFVNQACVLYFVLLRPVVG